jgi:hypothetical protein
VSGLLLSAAGVAQADVVYNNVDASVDAAAESMPLNVGGGTGTTTLAFPRPTMMARTAAI